MAVLKQRKGNTWQPTVAPAPVVNKHSNATYTIKHVPGNGSAPYYYIIKVFRDPSDRLMDKQYAYNTPSPAVAGVNRENIRDFAARTGANIVLNGSGWSPTNVPRGVQIKDGVLLQDWNVSVNNIGGCALASMEDGSVQLFEYANYTAQQVLDAGAWDTWCHGVAPLIKAGVTGVNSSTYGWGDRSAMNVAGCDSAGNYMFFQSYGVSGSAGFTMQEALTILHANGFYHALQLDGGGSTQSYVDGTELMPSSDGSPRGVCDAILIKADLIRDPNNSGWHNITLPAGATSLGLNRYRLIKGEGSGRGYLELNLHLSGLAGGAIVATLPIEARPTNYNFVLGASNTGTMSGVGIGSAGELGLIGGINFDASKALRVYGRVPMD